MQENPIDSYISVNKNFFPQDFCDKWVNFYANKIYNAHQWQDDNDAKFKINQQEFEVLYLDNNKDKEFVSVIVNNLFNCMQNYENDLKTRCYVSKFSPLRLNKYSASTKMNKHVDHIHDIFDGTEKGVPILSFIVNLNDDYEGGELVFFDDVKIKLDKGDVVIFPANFMYPHRIEPIINNTRYSLVCWGF